MAKGVVAIERLPLWQLGGEEAFAEYQKTFDECFRDESNPVIDVMGRRVMFYRESCRHVCFKGRADDPEDYGGRTEWKQDRADRIPWILYALTHPDTEIRPNIRYPERYSYIIVIEAVPTMNLPQEYFGVVTTQEIRGQVDFVTAYPLTYSSPNAREPATWLKWRQAGRPYYPPPAPRKPKKKP